MSTEKPTAVRVYLARVRTALADLPAGEIEEILEDVRPHLAEMESELGADARVEALIERLGTPESYAAELRASGGYPAPPSSGEAATVVLAPEKKPGLFGARFALWGLVFCALGLALFAFTAAVQLDPDALLGLLILVPVFALSLVFLLRRGVSAVLELPEVVRVRESVRSWRAEREDDKAMAYLRSLKPAWWIVCAVVLLAFGLLLMVRHTYAALLLPFLIAAAVAVVWAGPKARTDRRLLWVAVPVSAFVIGGAFGGFGAAIDLITHRSYYANTTSYSSPTTDNYGNQQLRYGDRELQNVYAFDAAGKPLTDIYLYDDQGRPLTVTRYGCEADTGSQSRVGEDNRFPRPQLVQGTQDDRGNRDGYNGYRAYCHEETGVPFAAAIPKPTSSAPATPSSSAPPSNSSSAAKPTTSSPAPPTR
ncbi:HAAS signaling domain-containing protein [Amycolatopsis sp. NPDC051903]|uniref:HAAS signaling domain-containing protein n=1 Tax=Amycolatopsis sp. NPDC051903 TaxID=3363936 RepID=UPI0037BDA3C5